jgi:hypothetical protein
MPRIIPIDMAATLWKEGKPLRVILMHINAQVEEPFKVESLEKAIARARRNGDTRFPYRKPQYDPNNR